MNYSPMTQDGFPTEAEAINTFVRIARCSGDFFVYTEVAGTLLNALPYNDSGKVRCDILLVPKKAAIDSGYDGGAIVVEVKKSGEKIGRPGAQLLDYMSSAFILPVSGLAVVPRLGFLFPVDPIGGSICSVLAQNRAGTCGYRPGRNGAMEYLYFKMSSSSTMTIGAGGSTFQNINYGKKIGSR